MARVVVRVIKLLGRHKSRLEGSEVVAVITDEKVLKFPFEIAD